jgi:hypothetical protein
VYAGAGRATQRWRRVGETPTHPLARVDGAEVGRAVRLAVELDGKSKVGSDYFRASLVIDGMGRTAGPILSGLFNRGAQPGFNWIEVGEYDGEPLLEDGRQIAIPEAIDLQIVLRLAELVPAGGHLMLEYDSPARRVTAQALAARVPPVATPLGAMMYAAGCGVAFRDWYIAEGGREGPRKLQGFRALDEAHARRRGTEMLHDLDAFMSRSNDHDWMVQGITRELASATITALREQLGAPEGPLAPD